MFNTEEYFDDVLDFISDGKIKEGAPLTWYQTTSEFNLPVGLITPWTSGHDKDTPHLAIKAGEMIAFGSIQFMDTDKKVKRSNIVYYKEQINFITTTRKFFDINIKVFTDITSQINRDNKINQII